jgi:molecular chaperone DnaK (HSP70)
MKYLTQLDLSTKISKRSRVQSQFLNQNRINDFTFDIFQVILAGGTSKIPKVQRTVIGLFKNAEYLSSINPGNEADVTSKTRN